eukprot:6657074-Prymnesium_polylepis.1
MVTINSYDLGVTANTLQYIPPWPGNKIRHITPRWGSFFDCLRRYWDEDCSAGRPAAGLRVTKPSQGPPTGMDRSKQRIVVVTTYNYTNKILRSAKRK